MTLEQLKTKITNNDVNDITVVVFKDKERFISTQYINEISKLLNKEIHYYDDFNSVIKSFNNAWIPNNYINVYKTSEFEFDEAFPNKLKNTFIVCEKTDLPCVEIPKLERWQVEEYINVNVDMNPSKLYDICKGNVWRIYNEITKLKLFPCPEKTFEQFVGDGQYSDIENGVIWDYISALFNKDLNTIRNIMPGIISGANDVTDFFLLVSLFNKLIKVIQVQLDPNPTPQSTGMTDKQIWACKKYDCSKLTTQQLYKIFDEVTSLDARVKRGEFPTEWVVDYITVLFLGR